MSTPPPGGENEDLAPGGEQPPGEQPREAGPGDAPPPAPEGGAGRVEAAAQKPSWAWEPDLAAGAEFEVDPGIMSGAEPPVSSESGQEMLRRLFERGLISKEEYAERAGPGAAREPGDDAGRADSPPEPVIGSEPEVPGPVGAVDTPPEPPPPPALEWDAAPPPPPPPTAWEPPPPPPPTAAEPYPMHYDVAYPESMNRGTTFIRVILLIPVLLFLTLLNYFVSLAYALGWTTVFWRRKYPNWLFRGLSGAFGFQARAYAYALLLTDRFPSFAPEDHPVTLEYDEPPSGYLSRWRVFFWKAVLLIPHLFVLWLLSFAVFAVTVLAWFGILFTGNYPRGLFQFGVGVQRWWWRVWGYFASFNDRFPPFALSEKAGPAGNSSTVVSGIFGGLAAGGMAALIITGAVIANRHYTVEVDYAQLQQGRQQPARSFPAFGNEEVRLTLVRVHDPGDDLVQVLRPASNERIIVFQWTMVNRGPASALVDDRGPRLKVAYQDDDGDDTERSIGAVIVTVNNVVPPARVREGRTATIQAVFVVPEDATPLELRFRGGFLGGGVKYVFD